MFHGLDAEAWIWLILLIFSVQEDEPWASVGVSPRPPGRSPFHLKTNSIHDTSQVKKGIADRLNVLSRVLSEPEGSSVSLIPQALTPHSKHCGWRCYMSFLRLKVFLEFDILKVITPLYFNNGKPPLTKDWEFF